MSLLHQRGALKLLSLLLFLLPLIANALTIEAPVVKYPVGVTSTALTDRSRSMDPFEQSNPPREVMISVFHPVDGHEPSTVPYMPQKAALITGEQYAALA